MYTFAIDQGRMKGQVMLNPNLNACRINESGVA